MFDHATAGSQHRAGMGSQFLRERLNLDRPVKIWCKKRTLSFTHRVILPWPGIVVVRPLDTEDHAIVLSIDDEARE